jgi:hypothetical protein
MAERPVFQPLAAAPWVHRRSVTFSWHAGLAVSQKQKSVASLHESARRVFQLSSLLEISSKSTRPEGLAASAFNLKIELPDGTRTCLECAYQGSKRFADGGPYTDLFRGAPLDAKRDERIRSSSGRLLSFDFFGSNWPLEPQSLFYDWLYLTAMSQAHNAQLLSKVRANDGFTDIEFNPEKSVSCQANSAALLTGMLQASVDLAEAANPERFLELVAAPTGFTERGQAPLF